MERREFLGTAALGGTTIVGASALGATDAEAAFADPMRPIDAAVTATSFAEGRITRIEDTLLYVAGSWGDHHRIQATNGTSVWKKQHTTIDAAKVGDGLYARGVEMPDGVIAADAIWINIVNIFCTISDVRRHHVRLQHGNHALLGRLDRGTTVASELGGTPKHDLSVLRANRPVQVLGAWRPDDDSIDVVRMWMGHG